jgi:hypothetical protein
MALMFSAAMFTFINCGKILTDLAEYGVNLHLCLSPIAGWEPRPCDRGG